MICGSSLRHGVQNMTLQLILDGADEYQEKNGHKLWSQDSYHSGYIWHARFICTKTEGRYDMLWSYHSLRAICLDQSDDKFVFGIIASNNKSKLPV